MVSTAAALEKMDTGPTGTRIGTPLTVDDADTAQWDDECDLLVVGAGLAGSASALKAAEDSNAKILVIDRFDGGGASQQSGGILYLGGGTKVQQEVGVEDSVEDMVNYLLLETGNVVSRDTLERFCRDSASIVPWLERYGVRFGGPMTEVKTSNPGKEYLYYSGNERLKDSLKVARPAPRGHRAKPPSLDGKNELSGRDLMAPIKQALDDAANIRVQRRTAASRLIKDASGRVVGVEVRQLRPGSFGAWLHKKMMQANGNMTLLMLGISKPMLKVALAVERSRATTRRIRARRGVVLSTGGYIHNPALIEQVSPTYKNTVPLGTVGDDGSGIMLGHSVGGATDRLETVSAWRFLYPPEVWTKGVLVGPNGERLVNEESYGARIGAAMFEKAGGLGWLILDKPLFETAQQQMKDPDILGFQKLTIGIGALRMYAKHAPTLEAAAQKVGLPPQAVAATIARYNADIAAGRDDPFGKAAKLCAPIVTAPFTIIDLSYRTKFHPLPGLSMGGLRVDETTGAVLGENGQPIAGLYAAGRTAVGLPSNLYVSGLSLADCVWSGWRAASNATSQAA